MAIEPERSIEKLLRACAKKRRDEAGPPLELHPATRRVLQGEVARKFARDKRPPESFSRVPARLWPRFAWGAAAFAVLAILALVLVPGSNKDRKEARLAMNEPLPEASLTKELAPQPAAAPVIAPPESAARADHAMLANSDRASSGRDQTTRQLGAEQADRAKTRTEEMATATAGEPMAPTAATPSKESKKAARTTISPADGPFQSPTAPGEGEAFRRRYSLADNANSPVEAPIAPASPAPSAAPVTASAGKTVPTEDRFKPTAESSGKLALAYKAPASAISPSQMTPSVDASKDLLGSVAGAAGEGNRLGLSQRFAQVTPEAKAKRGFADKASPAQPVLASFQVEQSGPELRIVDRDGSVYSGFVRIADGVERLRSVNGEKPAAARAWKALAAKSELQSAAAPDASGPAGQSYFFRVAGTNRTLHKQVVFTGNLMAATNLILVTQATNAWNGNSPVGGSPSAPAVQSPQPLLNSRISGKAVIGDRKEIEVNALPTGP